MPVTRSTEIRDTTLNPTVTTDRGCTTGHNHTLSLSLPWAGTWHLQCSKLGVSTQSKGQISHLRARNVHRHECVTLAEFTEAPLLHVWRQDGDRSDTDREAACVPSTQRHPNLDKFFAVCVSGRGRGVLAVQSFRADQRKVHHLVRYHLRGRQWLACFGAQNDFSKLGESI